MIPHRDIPRDALPTVVRTLEPEGHDDQREGRGVIVWALFAGWFASGFLAGVGACKAAGW